MMQVIGNEQFFKICLMATYALGHMMYGYTLLEYSNLTL